MSKIAAAYEEAIKCFKEGSAYEKALMEGWFDSNAMDNLLPRDPRQFTNEVLLKAEERSTTLMRYPKWQCINNHILHKWIIKELGLYEKSKFL